MPTHLLRDLSKVVNEVYGCIPFILIINAVDINIALIKEVVEHIAGVHGGLALLLVSKYQINPLVEMCTDVVALQRLAMNPHKLSSVTLGPRG